jgi:cellobiose phosphorylase
MQLGMNCWTQYCLDISMRFRQGAKIGYRDILQYCRGYMPFDWKKCRDEIRGILTHQYADGRGIRGYIPLGLGLDLRDARDGVSWMADTLSTYIKETGDTSLLKEVVPYFDKGKGTVWDHACRAVDFLYKHRGRHKQCLVSEGDWNDALNLGGGKGRGESTWLTIATCRALRYTAEIARHIGKKKEAAKFERWRKQLAEDVNRYAWNGGWYIYGFTDDGTPVGSKKNREGQIYANVQTWALMEGIVPKRREAKVWKAIYDYLVTDVGILVHHTEYTRYDPAVGRITAMPRGTYEHAASYVHGTGFLIAALVRYRMGTCAVDAWHSVVPTNPKNPNSGCEPFGCTTYYAGPSNPQFGRSDSSWFTGSTSWLFFQCLEGILGVQPDYDGLRIDPVIPGGWKGFKVIRKFRGATYVITVRNPNGVESGVTQVKLNGKVLDGSLVPAQKRGTHRVNVLLG